MQTQAPRQKANKAGQFYEDWMDFRNRERRASTATTETIKSVKGGKFHLYDEYKARFSKTPASFGKMGLKLLMIVVLQSSTPTPPPPQPVVSTSAKSRRQSLPIIQPIRERNIKSSEAKLIDWDNLDPQMKARIQADFGPFYKWVQNGRTDDLKKEIIKKLLFKTSK